MEIVDYSRGAGVGMYVSEARVSVITSFEAQTSVMYTLAFCLKFADFHFTIQLIPLISPQK